VLGNRKLLYDLLLSTSWQTLAELGADPKHLGARLGAIAVLHTWGQQLEHHPHVHMIVPGGGPSLDGARWIASRPNFLLPVKVLGKLFRGKFLAELRQASVSGQLAYAGSTASLVNPGDSMPS
jgi:Putative transposase.